MNHTGASTGKAKTRAATHTIGLRIAWCAAVLVAAVFAAAALAQDVPGIEICTSESRMDRRTGCLQSNVEFLQRVITKNALDAEKKLTAAGRDIAALKEQLAAVNRESAALKEMLAALDARIVQLEKTAGPKTDAKK
jgi:septal ring factor EnvC (AmiA/AmiB activator)